MDKKRGIIFDMDGTLASIEHRRHFVQTKPKNWKAFFRAMKDDEPIGVVVDALRLYQAAGYGIIVCSGRPSEYREDTINWMVKHDIHFDALFMRRQGDFRDDGIVKSELLDQIWKDWNVNLAYDDRDRVVEMWRRRGIHCFQVAKGDF